MSVKANKPKKIYVPVTKGGPLKVEAQQRKGKRVILVHDEDGHPLEVCGSFSALLRVLARIQYSPKVYVYEVLQ